MGDAGWAGGWLAGLQTHAGRGGYKCQYRYIGRSVNSGQWSVVSG